MNRRSFVAGIAALLPLGWFGGKKEKKVKSFHEHFLDAVPCPWCGGRCMYLEVDEFCGLRLGADCDESYEVFTSSINDAVRNDYGRTGWHQTIEEVVEEWNDTLWSVGQNKSARSLVNARK